MNALTSNLIFWIEFFINREDDAAPEPIFTVTKSKVTKSLERVRMHLTDERSVMWKNLLLWVEHLITEDSVLFRVRPLRSNMLMP